MRCSTVLPLLTVGSPRATLCERQIERTHPGPLRSFVRYEPTHLMVGEESKDYELMGKPSDELDAAWKHLMQDFFTEVPYSYVAKVDRLDEGIPTKDGGFLATYSFMHNLHCLV